MLEFGNTVVGVSTHSLKYQVFTQTKAEKPNIPLA